MADTVETLEELLSASVSSLCKEKTGIIFSSGVDSMIIAVLAARFSRVNAYVVGYEGSPDLACALSIGADYGFEIQPVIIDDDKVDAVLPEITKIVGEPNPVKVGVGVPMYFASKAAKEDGFDVMLCGQGADEIFGGYNRYIESYVSGGPDKVGQMMASDIQTADEDNLDRDRAVTAHNGIELRFPYLGAEFLEYSVGLPLDLKVREVDASFNEFTCIDEVEGRHFVRKYAIRRLAARLDVVTQIINRPKKAAQYGSHVNKNLEKIAKRHGHKRTREYLETLM
ncbi:asparagine synthase C-terminal domain-containing protein [Candidatus Altiarchaeota archaeon]